MLNRLLIGAAGLVAGTLVATPAVLGLSGNSSFSRDIHVPVPSGAHRVHFVESSDGAEASIEPEPSETTEDRPRGKGGVDDGPQHDVGDDHGDRRGGDNRDGGNSGPGDGSGGRGHG
jgi:hypothetical protein